MLKIETRDQNDHRVILVGGELDMESSPRLLESIRSALRGTGTLKIELSAVDYVDSSGIAVLIQGYKQALKKPVKYVLLNPSSQVMSVIELSQLQGFFSFETRDEETTG